VGRRSIPRQTKHTVADSEEDAHLLMDD
jgi:hypothetical protein